jgi:hypothetical protein
MKLVFSEGTGDACIGVQLFVYSCLVREYYGSNYTQIFSPYRAVNTLSLSYKNQLVNAVQ